MKRYDNIQIFRVLACLGVFVSHLAPKMGATGTTAKIANFGASGVYLFFLVSAFLACATADSGSAVRKCDGSDREASSWNIKKLLRYYAKRALRILPLYYAVILYNFLLHTFILQDVTADPAGLRWFRYIFLTNAFIPAPDNFWGNLTATWTISLFMVFYICAPFLTRLAGVSHSKENDKLSSDESTAKKGVIRASLLYIGFVVLQQIWSGLDCSDYMMCFYYMNFFILGILVWQLAGLQKKRAAVGIMAGICLVLGVGLYLWKGEIPYFTGVSWGYALLVLLTMGFSWERALKIPAVGALLTGVRKIFAVLDRHSYAIYLVHAVIIEGMVLVMAHVPLNGLAVGAISIALTAAGVGAAYLLIEKPVGKLCRRFR